MSLKKILLFVVFVFYLTTTFSQRVLQSMSGKVFDAQTHLPLDSAEIILPLGNVVLRDTSDANGGFSFTEVPVGRYDLQVVRKGYEIFSQREMQVTSGKKIILEIYLIPSAKTLKGVDIVSKRTTFDEARSRSISVEETQRYASVNEDVARMAQTFPGVTFVNDGVNHISVNGHSPNAVLWRLEGIDILNPNHLSNGGTISDRPSQSGGGVLMMSAQVLDNTKFSTAPFSAEVGNVLGGVFDLNFRKGNTNKHACTAQLGLIGIDLSCEGPLGEKKSNSYLFNYRYSTVGILSAMGVDFGGEKIAFQDFSFNVNFPLKKAGELNVFGVGGINTTDFKGKEDSTEWETEKDKLNIDFESKMGTVGVAHKIPLGKNLFWKNVVSFSALETEREATSAGALFVPYFTGELYSNQTNYSFRSDLTWVHNSKSALMIGGSVKYAHDNFFNPDYILISDVQKSLGQGNSYLMQPYINWNCFFYKKLKLTLGVHDIYYSLNKQNAVEPRAQLQWNMSSKHTLVAAYGLGSQLQPAEIYYATDFSTAVPGYYFNPNRNLGFTKAHQYSLSYTFLSTVNTFRAEVYYNELFDVPVEKNNLSSYSLVNEQETFNNIALVNTGEAENCGINMSFQKFFTAKYYCLLSGSVYSARYEGSDGVERDSRFNGKYAFSATGGYEVKKEKQRKMRTIGYNVRVIYNGGYRESAVDESLSQSFGHTVYNEQYAFENKLKDYFRVDFRIVIRKNKTKFSQQWALDIQNLTGIENDQYHYYDSVKKQTTIKKQLGLIPILSWRIEI